ncbi:uncharacterized protein C8A04DRAFT_33147 [Dichotomopilus funicola]|uniref:Uncharacterized protein n=1 Tax=Dichotomopilus funicola TaxID=1934379 RepID=A0AAN6UX02_9PEZI|nr:hypothetical protein C8A04DRAFT_33147 [Dichotomopilus funicola]
MATRREPSQHGITTVYHHPKAQADILFIHGLGGNPGRTWKATSNDVFWPTDLLPASLGDNLPVNILTYGYNAEVFSWFWEKPKPTTSTATGNDGDDNRTGSGKPKPKNPSTDPIHQHAHTLIAQLTSHRQSQNTARLPLIWVAHSLGGVLAKRALLYSHEVLTARMAEYRSIFISTYAMIFLGTPHDGSDLATLGRWVRGGLGTVLPRRVFDSESVLLGTLVPGGEVLGEISDRFLEVYQRFEMHMVWENWKTDLGVTKALIVKRQSAAPQLPGVFRYGIEATHSGMCKFDSVSASGYGTLSTAMRKWVGDAPSTILVRWAHEDEDRRRIIQREGLERVAAEYRAAGLDPPEQLAFVQTDPLDPTRPILQSPTSTTTPLPRSNNPTPSNPSNDPPFIHPTTIRPNDYTVGRTAELHQLHTLLTDPRRRAHGTAAVLIQCLTGGGKTHLAREYVFRYREHYKGGVFWVPAGSRRELETWFGWVAKGVGIDTSVPVQEKNGSSSSSDTKKSGSRSSTRDTPPLVHAVRRWLNTHPHWLLVLDDIHFDTPGLADFIPDDAPPNTSLLYTSTERAVKGDQRFLGNPSVLELGLLPAAEAQQLFLEIAAPRRRPWSDAEKELVRELVELMGRLPLMVQFAAQHVAHTGEPLAGFVRMYRRKPGARALEPYRMLRKGLEERGEHAALNLMCLLVFFGGMVPVEMVVFGLPGLDKATPIKTRDAALGTTTLNNTLKILKRTSLLDRADSSQPPSPASTSLTSSFERPAPTATTAGAAGTSAGTEYLDLLSMHNVTRAYFIDWLREKKQILFWLKNAITLWSRAYDEASRRMREDPVAVGVADDYRRFGVHGEKLLANWEMFAKRRREVGEVRGELERRLGEIRGCVERLAERDSQGHNTELDEDKGKGRVQPASVFDRVSASSQTDSYDSQPSGLDSPLDGPEFPGLAIGVDFETGFRQQQQPQRALPYPDNQVMPTAPEFGGEDMENERDDDQDTMVLSTTGTQVHVGGTNADADEVGSVISRLADHRNPHDTQQDVTAMVEDWQRDLPHHRVVQWQRQSQHKHRVRLRAGGWQEEHSKSGPWLGLTYDDTLGLSVQRDEEARPELHERTQSEAEMDLNRIKMASSVASSPRLGSVGSPTARGSSTAKGSSTARGSWVGGLGVWSPWGSMRKKQSPVGGVPEELPAGPQQQHAQTQTPDRLSPPQPQPQQPPNIFPTPNPYPRSTNSSPGPNPRATATASPFPPPSFSGIPTDDLLPSRPSVSVSGQPGQPGQQQPATGGGPVVVRHWNTFVYHPHGTPISNTSGVDWSSSDWSGSPDPMSLSYPTFPSYQRYPPGDGPVPASFIRGNSVVGNAGNPPFQSYPVQRQQRQQGQPLSFDDARYYYPSTTTNTATAGPIPGQSPGPGPGPGPVPGSGSGSRSPIRAQRIPTANATRLKKRMPLSTSRPVVSYTMTEPDPRLEPVLSDGEGEMEEEMVGLGLRSDITYLNLDLNTNTYISSSSSNTHNTHNTNTPNRC